MVSSSHSLAASSELGERLVPPVGNLWLDMGSSRCSDGGERIFLPVLLRKDDLGARSRHRFRDALRAWWWRKQAPLRPCLSGAENV